MEEMTDEQKSKVVQDLTFKQKMQIGALGLQNKAVSTSNDIDNNFEENHRNNYNKLNQQANELGEQVQKSVNKASNKIKGWFSRKKDD